MSEIAKGLLAPGFDPELARTVAKIAAQILVGTLTEVNGQWYHHARVNLDGYKFVNCRFDACEIQVQKGTFRLENCYFDGCMFVYGGEALKVVRLHNRTLQYFTVPQLQPTINDDGTLTVSDGALGEGDAFAGGNEDQPVRKA
jgi:hypothetical protein